ncbi:biogenesis of lysosome-related organelles complex 1 subunit 6 isoform X2 [Toxorhynchites rutilus septentrionalis]|uniref:biogenesis of lysosome-related organelles complex 1 subunit 6 isoform X2 n=1 Tax=Toxorhynchites rutilus septentrionalis TaxID=329112 RepID=UPI002478527C|nr:biogenesis of lysosome-related organelles complex 1 subunit 6 isoform X2 [Toxorhynchites rutilus septentrionalis]
MTEETPNNGNEAAEIKEYNETVKTLSAGLLQIYEPTLNQVKGNLKELLNKQNDMLLIIDNEKRAFASQEVQMINEMINKAKIYREKAVRIKYQMHQIHQRAKNIRDLSTVGENLSFRSL